MMLGTFIWFYTCWIAIAIWLILGVVTDWEEKYRLLYDGCGFLIFVAMFAVIWMTCGPTSKKILLINNIHENMCLKWRRIAIYAILLIMENDILEFVAPVEDKMQGIIKVVGVGGGGRESLL